MTGFAALIGSGVHSYNAFSFIITSMGVIKKKEKKCA